MSPYPAKPHFDRPSGHGVHRITRCETFSDVQAALGNSGIAFEQRDRSQHRMAGKEICAAIGDAFRPRPWLRDQVHARWRSELQEGVVTRGSVIGPEWVALPFRKNGTCALHRGLPLERIGQFGMNEGEVLQINAILGGSVPQGVVDMAPDACRDRAGEITCDLKRPTS